MGQVIAVIGKKSHVEVRKGTRTQARDYARKASTRVENTQVEFGTWTPDRSRRKKLRDYLAPGMTMKQLVEEAPEVYVRHYKGLRALQNFRNKEKSKDFRYVKVIVYYGPTGCGKSRLAYDCKGQDFFPVPSGDKLWMDNYAGEPIIVVNDFYGGSMKYSTFLNLCDGQPAQYPTKGSHIYPLWTEVRITSNKHPSQWYKKGFTDAMKRRITEIKYMGGATDPQMSFVDDFVAYKPGTYFTFN